jgi:hypothetical protein
MQLENHYLKKNYMKKKRKDAYLHYVSFLTGTDMNIRHTQP